MESMAERGHGLLEAGKEEKLQRLVDEQTALRRVATLVATGATDLDLVAAVTSEIAQLFGAHRATAIRWDGDCVRVIGDWTDDGKAMTLADRVYAFGGDTLTARVVGSSRPARVEGLDDLHTDFARERWQELGIQAAIGAPIIVDGRVWGVIMASRRTLDDPFPSGAEHRLGDFAALVAQAIANSEARLEVAALAEEQASLRRVATLVAGGRPQPEVLAAATGEVGRIFSARAVYFVRWEGVHDEVRLVGGWTDGSEPAVESRLYHPSPGGATLKVLETGFASRGAETSPELGPRFAIAAPVIVSANLEGTLAAFRAADAPFPAGAEVRLRSFADLISQAIANARAQEEMRASRARIVRAGDEARRRLERNLHDGAQQRLVSASLSLRLALAKLPPDAVDSKAILAGAADELTLAIDELRELARGIHPAVLTEQGLELALGALAERSPMKVAVCTNLDDRLSADVEAAAYYVVAESLTNCARYARASTVEVKVTRFDEVVRVEVIDDGVGGADLSRGSGIRGLADRVEALDGKLDLESPPSRGTRVSAEIPLAPRLP
jgi:signal transduction histidine kinase